MPFMRNNWPNMAVAAVFAMPTYLLLRWHDRSNSLITVRPMLRILPPAMVLEFHAIIHLLTAINALLSLRLNFFWL